MKKKFLYLAASIVIVSSACKSKGKEQSSQETTPVETSTTSETPAAPTNQPKEYKVTFTTDSALLGKEKEALIKLLGGTAIALQDADGKDNGIELSIKLSVTNKHTIENGSGLSVSYADSRLQLDNGTNVTASTGSDFLRAQPEATSGVETWKYQIPAGAKPKGLTLFMNETRVSLPVTLQ